jgi:hypothetical protein
MLEFGHILIGHCLIEEGFESGVKLGKGFNLGKGWSVALQ